MIRLTAGAIAGAAVAPAAGTARGLALPQPTAALVTGWRRDPFARGAYSFLAVGSTPADRRALAQPSGPRLVLAGEHTHVDAPAMTHGAYLSGRRAAAQVIAALGAGAGDAPVVVIGAGMAGLAAARRLRAADIPVVVLEARPRVGGRTVTDDGLGVPVDLGAGWIHGIRSNPMSDLVRATGGSWHASNPDRSATFDAGGHRLTAARLDAVWRRAEAAVRSTEQSWDDAVDSSVASWVNPALADLTGAQRLLVQLEVRRSVEHEYGGSLARLSAQWFDEGEELDGAEVLLRKGYGPLVAHLADGLRIRLGVEVLAIDHSAGGAVVHTPGGPIDAAAVVCTVPLGVLKTGGPVFDPPLPRRQRQAIERLGTAHLEKVALRFPRRFWPDVDYLGVTRVDGRFLEWVPLHRVVGAPVIVAFTAADATRDLVALDDATVVRQAVATLHGALG